MNKYHDFLKNLLKNSYVYLIVMTIGVYMLVDTILILNRSNQENVIRILLAPIILITWSIISLALKIRKNKYPIQKDEEHQ